MIDTLSTNISNLVSLLLHSLSFSSLLPALVFVVLNGSVVLPLLEKHKVIDLGNQPGVPQLVLLTSLLTVLIGYTLRVLNFSIIGFFEGYPFRLSWFGRLMTYCQYCRWRRLKKMVHELNEFIALESDKLPCEVVSDKRFRERIKNSDLLKYVEREKAAFGTSLELYFPSHHSSVAPTALGNAIAAFEEYPKARYGMDAVFLWPRLVPILSQEEYAIFVEKEKAGFDFLLNLSLLMGVFAFECLMLSLAGAELTALIPVAALVSAYLLYRGSIQAASNWGETVKVAFDSYRYQLARQLSIKPFYDKSGESARWQGLSQFIVRGRSFHDFDYPLPKDSQSGNEK